MRFVFFALMCAFACIYTVKENISEEAVQPEELIIRKSLWTFLSRLFFRSASGTMAVMIAAASFAGAESQTYYTLIIIGLCAGLAADVLGALSEKYRNTLKAVIWFTAASGVFYICAFYTRSPFSWIDIALFMLTAAPAAALLYNKKKFSRAKTLVLSAVFCAAAAKGITLLFIFHKRYIYAALAAAGALSFSVSNFMSVYREKSPYGKGAFGITKASLYYLGQALLAFSVSI